MKPSVGRIVHYWSVTPALMAVQTADGQNVVVEYHGPFAAIVTFVHGNGDVSLDVRVPEKARGLKGFTGTDAVKHAPDDMPTHGAWNWPPREG